MQMAEEIFGDGVTVVSASYSGDNRSSAIYSNGDALAPGATPGDTGVILSTGVANHYINSNGQANQGTNTSTNTRGVNNNADFNAAAGTNTYDASYLDISFIPDSNVMTMQFVFASEEYPEYFNSVYQDFVGVWVNGTQVDIEVGDGDTEDFTFPYTVDNGANSDIGIVNISSIPCFVAATMIATPQGDRSVETLRPGDMVMTLDDGSQPVCWIGTRTVAAQGDFAPVHIPANTFGRHGDVMVSRQHRILVCTSIAELLFGEGEVLVAAKDLLNDHTVTRCPGGDVTYVHVMFDRHQVVFSDGLETESFLPGPQTCNLFEERVLREICAIFPELDPETDDGYSPAARRTLRGFEAEILKLNSRAA